MFGIHIGSKKSTYMIMYFSIMFKLSSVSMIKAQIGVKKLTDHRNAHNKIAMKEDDNRIDFQQFKSISHQCFPQSKDIYQLQGKEKNKHIQSYCCRKL